MATADPLKPTERRPALSRRVIAVVFAIVCALLAAAYVLFLRTDYAVVYTGLKPSDAAAIVSQLDAKGIPHRLRDDGATILVPADQADGVRVAIAGSDVPLKGAVGFELFNKSDMGLTDFAQKINYQRALQGELTRSITMMEGVETARVHLALPERSLFRAERTPPKAAVEVVAKLGSMIGEDRVRGIQRLVAAAVPDLDPENVTVLDGEGRVVSREVMTGSSAEPELSEQAAAQAYFEARARSALAARLPGVRFAVHVLAGVASGVAAGDEPAPAGGDAKRTFPLRVTIVSAAPLDAEDQGMARDAVAEAIGLHASIGDALTFQTGPIAPLPAPALATPLPVASAAPPAPTSDPAQPSGTSLSWIAIAGIAAILAIAVLATRRSGMPVAEQETLAARLKAELDRERADASV